MTEIDINVVKPERVVDIIVEPNIITVNVTVSGGGGGGAVDSVNGQTGVVVLDATDVGAYTTSEVDNLLNDKFDNPTGDNTQYLDGAGVPTTFPTIPDVTGFVPYTGANQNVDLGEFKLKAGQLELDQTPTGTAGVAVTRWNDTIGSTETTLKGGNVILKNGVDLVARVVNKVTPNTTLTKANYPAVRISGAQGQRLAVAYAQANNDNNSADTIGLVCETIAANQEGFIITVGQLEGINTTGSLQGETWADGDVLYLSPTTAGRLTNIKPTGATGHIVVIGYVEYAHAVNGKIYVKIMNGWELDELHNVNISSPTNNQVLAYTSSTQLWENKSVGTALGYTPENVANKATNLTSPDNTKYPTTLAMATALAGKLDANDWVDISLTSTITGFSTITVRTIEYLITGDECTVLANIQGTSNSPLLTFTLPFNYTGLSNFIDLSARIVNNGTAQNTGGMVRIIPGTNLVEVFLNGNATGFATVNNKQTQLAIKFKIN
jgi:nitrogen fixation protein